MDPNIRSGRNMSIAAVRKPSVMTFRCERSIGHYGNIQQVAQYLEIIIQVELAFRGYDLSSLRYNDKPAEIVKIS